jgi:hypothetical protein
MSELGPGERTAVLEPINQSPLAWNTSGMEIAPNGRDLMIYSVDHRQLFTLNLSAFLTGLRGDAQVERSTLPVFSSSYTGRPSRWINFRGHSPDGRFAVGISSEGDLLVISSDPDTQRPVLLEVDFVPNIRSQSMRSLPGDQMRDLVDRTVVEFSADSQTITVTSDNEVHQHTIR